MAKQLLGKEVTAAMNERLQARVAALKEKGVTPTLGILRIGQYIECDRSAQRPVLVVQCPNRQLAALKKQRNYPLVLHRSTLFLAKVI